MLLNVLVGIAFFCYVFIVIYKLRKLKESEVKDQIKVELKKKGVRRKRAILNPDTPDSSIIVKPILRKRPQPLTTMNSNKKAQRLKMLTEYPIQSQDDDFSKETLSPTRYLKYVSNTLGNENSPSLADTPRTSRSNKIRITLESPDDKAGKKAFSFSQFSRDRVQSRNNSFKDMNQNNSDSDSSRGFLTAYTPGTDREHLMKFSSFRTIHDTVVLSKIEKDNSDEKNESCEITVHEHKQEPEANLPNLSFIEIATPRTPRNKSEQPEGSDLENNQKSESDLGDVEEF